MIIKFNFYIFLPVAVLVVRGHMCYYAVKSSSGIRGDIHIHLAMKGTNITFVWLGIEALIFESWKNKVHVIFALKSC